MQTVNENPSPEERLAVSAITDALNSLSEQLAIAFYREGFSKEQSVSMVASALLIVATNSIRMAAETMHSPWTHADSTRVAKSFHELLFKEFQAITEKATSIN